MDKSPEAFRTISEVAEGMNLPQHVLRFWETRFPQIKPLKRGGGRRYYRPDDVRLLHGIRRLLYDEGYTIKGVQKLLREQGAAAFVEGSEASTSDRAQASADGPPHSAGLTFDDAPDRIEPSFAPARGAEAMSDSAVRMHTSHLNIKALRGVLAELREAEKVLAQARST